MELRGLNFYMLEFFFFFTTVLTHCAARTAGLGFYTQYVLILELEAYYSVVNKRHTKKAPYLDYVTINRTQLELRADGLIFKLGKGMRRKPQRLFIVAGT